MVKYQDIFPIPIEWLQDSDVAIAESVASWGEQEVRSRRLEHREDYDRLIAPALEKLVKDVGLGGMLLPEQYGGGGLSTPDAAMTAAVLLEQVSAADTGIAFLLANTLTLQSMLAPGYGADDSLLEEVAPVFCGEAPGTASLVLPAYGSGPAQDLPRFNGLDYQVAADFGGGEWVLRGTGVRPQCSGARAALFGVLLADEGGAPALALVRPDAAGLAAGEPFKKTGLAASVNADLVFDGVRVPERNVLRIGDDGARSLLARYYSACSAVCTGAMLAAYEIIKEWGNTRVIKGKGQVFKENPLVASLMGETGGRTCAGRMLAYSAARLLSRPEIYGPPGGQAVFATATAVFMQVSRSAMLSLDNIMELMASAGYATEWNLERYWRDVKTVETYVVPETVACVDMARHYFSLERI